MRLLERFRWYRTLVDHQIRPRRVIYKLMADEVPPDVEATFGMTILALMRRLVDDGEALVLTDDELRAVGSRVVLYRYVIGGIRLELADISDPRVVR